MNATRQIDAPLKCALMDLRCQIAMFMFMLQLNWHLHTKRGHLVCRVLPYSEGVNLFIRCE